MRLVVSKYEVDEAGSLDCALCSEGTMDKQFTVVSWWDEKTGLSITVCAEHLDEMVKAALDRHKDGLEKNNAFWYLDPDPAPWE